MRSGPFVPTIVAAWPKHFGVAVAVGVPNQATASPHPTRGPMKRLELVLLLLVLARDKTRTRGRFVQDENRGLPERLRKGGGNERRSGAEVQRGAFTGRSCATRGWLPRFVEVRVSALSLLCASAFLAATADAFGAQCHGHPATLIGTAGNDYLVGTAKKDVIVAHGGNDRIFGLERDDFVCAGLGDDVVRGGDGGDFLYGGRGEDVIYGGVGNDYLRDGGGNDKVFGRAGHDHAGGFPGNDLVWLGRGSDHGLDGRGNDVFRGQAGLDFFATTSGTGSDLFDGGPDGSVLIWYGSDPVVVDLSTGLLTSDETKTLRSIQNVTGGDGADTLIGDEFANFIRGGLGNDHIEGGGADDNLWGDAGDDFLDGGDGTDFLWGADGTDTCLSAETSADCEV